MKIFFTISSLVILLFTLTANKAKEASSNIKSTHNQAIIIEGEIGTSTLRAFNGCGIGNFLIPSTGDAAQGMPPVIGSISDYSEYNILDTIPGAEIKGVAFRRESLLGNTSIISQYYNEYPYVVISDIGMFSYRVSASFSPYSEELIGLDTIAIPNIVKVAQQTTTDANNPIVLLVKNAADDYGIQFYTYPELEEQFSFSFNFEPEIFEVIENNLFIGGLDNDGQQKIYHYIIAENTFYQTYTLNETASDQKEVIKSGDLLYALSSPGDSMTVLSTIDLINLTIDQSIINSQSGIRATNNEFRGDDFFTFQLISDDSGAELDKQILILDPLTNELDTLMINLELDYFKHPEVAVQDFGYFALSWVGAKWQENDADLAYIDYYSNVISLPTGAMPQYINATYGCWVGIDEPELDKIKFEYYPNPASSNVTIHLSGLQKGKKYQLDISDNLGKILYTTHLEAYQNIELPLQQFAKGVYFLNLNIGEHMIGKKLVIQ